VVFTDTNGNLINNVTVGALPDMLTFTPDGNKVIVANEGEPSENIGANPKGSISVIDISGGAASASVTPVGFEAFDGVLGATSGNDIKSQVRINSNSATASDDIEPEYISISTD